MNTQIKTSHLLLIDANKEILEAAILGNQFLEKQIGATVPNNWTQFGERALTHSLQKLSLGLDEQGWWSYLPVHQADNKLIGLCGYKGKPNENGMVEIGYEIMAEYREKGLATELANALIANAFSLQEINVIQAHTLGQMNASTKVLIKCGFEKIQEIENSEIGTLWKWELKRDRQIKNL